MRQLSKMGKLSLMVLVLALSTGVCHGALPTTTQPTTTEVQNPNVFEGWIVKIDYTKNMFRLLDPRGFEKKIKTKPGIIGDYRMGDHIRVEVDPAIKTAYTIEKLV